jgi:uncharacterized protein
MNNSSKLIKLRKIISEKESVVIAFSGGVDSSLIAKIAFEHLGEKSLAVTIDSDTFSKRELLLSKRIAREIGIRHRILSVSELNNPEFTKNPVDRCYHCKMEEINALKNVAAQFRFSCIAFGVNGSDYSEHRPGIRALEEEGFFLPLVEAGINKSIIASLAKSAGLSNYNLSSTTCLASRIPYGECITASKLKRIERGEAILYSLGVRHSRVRNHENSARIEIDETDIPIIIQHRRNIITKFKKLGFTYISLDLEGYRSGSLNETL